ncbi:MAG: GTPase HflX, partial [Phenylobacterium sp.]|nr:GTPase HflX [Phenylobacterium sp.]
AIVADTVGFISDLPHELVEAFRATLEEVREADVILHVRDVAGDESQAQADDVAGVLDRLGVDLETRRVLEIWNKADLLDADTRESLTGDARRRHPPALLVSAHTGQGCSELLDAVAGMVDDADPIEAHVPAGEGAAIAWLYRNGRVVESLPAEDGGVVMSVRLTAQALGQFEQLYPQAELRVH